MAQGIEYDENRVVALDKSDAMMGYDQSRVSYDQKRVMAQFAFFGPPALAYDEGRVVNDQANVYLLGYDRRIAVDNDRVLIDGTESVPLIPLVPPPVVGALPDIEDFAIAIRVGN